MNQLPPDWLPATTGQQHAYRTPDHGDIELASERHIVYVADPHNPALFVGVDRSLLPADYFTPARPVMPQRAGVDPQAQVILAKGAATGMIGAGVGWGVGEIFNSMAGLGSGTVFWLACLALVLKANGARGGSYREGDTYNVTNINKWWGKSSTRI